MRIYVLIFFLLCSVASMAMQIEKNSPEKGLTLKDATSLLRSHARIYVLEDGTIKILFLGLLVADGVFTVLPGLVLSLPFSLNMCPKVFGDHHNESLGLGENSTLAINGTNSVEIKPNYCYFGLGSLSLPALSYVSTLLIYPLGKLYQVWTLWMNRRIEEKINRELKKDRLENEILDDNDIRYLGKLIFEEKDLLHKLSLNQSLILAEIDLKKFREENEYFSQFTQQYGQKLLRFLEMSKEDFLAECAKEKVHEIFRNYPSLWQALARILFKRDSTDEVILSALKESLRKSLTFDIDNLHMDMIFESIVKKGNSIHDIILKAVFVEKYTKDSKITIIHGNKPWDISKNRLMEISDFFKTATTENWRPKKKTASAEMDTLIPLIDLNAQNEQIDLSLVNRDLVDVLINIALNNPVKISKKTITTVLEAADYFAMPALITRCDNFIKENNLSEEIFQAYESEKSIDVKLTFCKKYGLRENYRALIIETKNRLDNIEISDLSVLDDIVRLNLDEQTEIAKTYYGEKFNKKLSNHLFLKAIWPRAKAIAFLNTAIVQFCRKNSNQDIVEKAWVTIPEDLEKAIRTRD